MRAFLEHEFSVDKPDGDNQLRNASIGYGLALRIVADFTVTIALPALIVVILREYFGYFGEGPWLFIALLAVAFLISATLIVRKTKKYEQLYKDQSR